MPDDAELLVFDDASDDGTSVVLDSWIRRDKRVRMIQSAESVGGGAARNACLRASDSDLVASMDADDICLPWRFRIQLRMLRDADLAFGAPIRFGSTRVQMRPTNPFNYRGFEVNTALLLHNPLSHPTMTGRRSGLEAVGGYDTMRAAQDYDLWLRCASKGLTLLRSGLPLVMYRQTPNQVSRQPGYEDKVVGTPSLRLSHQELASALIRPLSLPEVSSGKLQVPRTGLVKLIGQMRLPLRAYYSRLLQSRRLLLIEVC
jgi:cellulose synthase/poly-beta-1,6-N-acetylglucosamine synthase-like glycosyltransferase